MMMAAISSRSLEELRDGANLEGHSQNITFGPRAANLYGDICLRRKGAPFQDETLSFQMSHFSSQTYSLGNRQHEVREGCVLRVSCNFCATPYEWESDEILVRRRICE